MHLSHRWFQKHTAGEGGGVTIFIPSLARERQTVETRLRPHQNAPEPKAEPQPQVASSEPAPSMTPTQPVPPLVHTSSSQPATTIAAQPLMPTVAASQPSAMAAHPPMTMPQPPPRPPPPLPPHWKEVPDPSSGDIYYWNSQTGETSWDRPAPAIVWQAQIDPNSGSPSLLPS